MCTDMHGTVLIWEDWQPCADVKRAETEEPCVSEFRHTLRVPPSWLSAMLCSQQVTWPYDACHYITWLQLHTGRVLLFVIILVVCLFTITIIIIIIIIIFFFFFFFFFTFPVLSLLPLPLLLNNASYFLLLLTLFLRFFFIRSSQFNFYSYRITPPLSLTTLFFFP